MARQTILCPRCGQPVSTDMRFCTKCGMPLQAPAPTPTPAPAAVQAPAPMQAPAPAPTPKRQRGGRIVATILGLLCGFALVVAGLLAVAAMQQGQSGSEDSGTSGATKTPNILRIFVPQANDTVQTEVEEPNNVQVELVSLDATDFPTMRAYVRVLDAQGSIVDLNGPHATVREAVSGGQIIEREVRSFMRVSEGQGLSYGIAVDKSGSMDDSMPRMRQILTEFVQSLDYGAGDRAELLSFDSYVMWMCSMTGDASRLVSGIQSMEAWGQTALWDALYEAVRSVGTQAGARCVVAFTDGDDNASSHSPDDVAALSQALGVPVFIVGTGDVDAAALSSLAGRCGGTYLPIYKVADFSCK